MNLYKLAELLRSKRITIQSLVKISQGTIKEHITHNSKHYYIIDNDYLSLEGTTKQMKEDLKSYFIKHSTEKEFTYYIDLK